MNILIIKLGAAGDVVRTTPLLRCFPHDRVTWLTLKTKTELLCGTAPNLRVVSWDQRHLLRKTKYDLVINLEDDLAVARFVRLISTKQIFGAHLNVGDLLSYTVDSAPWFDLSLISLHGIEKANRLKLENRSTYQELIFRSLGLHFNDEHYCIARSIHTGLEGDVAIAPVAGATWPMKNWAYYDQLALELETAGYHVNVLPLRSSLLEHLADIVGHRVIVSGDSLPMHLALGTGIPCVTLFTCTSPWEIYGYGIQTKIVSPLLEEYFYRRDFDVKATTSIAVGEALRAIEALFQIEALFLGKVNVAHP